MLAQPRAAHRCLAARPCGLSEPAARCAPVTVLSGRSPRRRPAQRGAGRERSGRRGELKMSLRSGAEAVSEDSGGAGRAAMKSEAQQRLQLNQFGDKNSVCRPCFCSDFIKVSAASERKPACVSLPPLQTGERSKIATTTGALFSFCSPFLGFPVSHSLPEPPEVPLG